MSAPPRSPIAPRARRRIAGALAALALGAAAAVLVSCGSSSSLIPSADSAPLQRDFEEVARAASSGEGSCAATEAAVLKTEQDYAALPASLDSGLRKTLREGITNLRNRALAECAQSAGTTLTTTTPKTTTTNTATTTTTTETATTPTNTETAITETTPPTTTSSGPGGGVQAPKEGEVPAGGTGGGAGAGGTGAAGATP